MAQVNVFYEPDTEVLTIFWQSPRKNQICTELDNGLILIKDETTGSDRPRNSQKMRCTFTCMRVKSLNLGRFKRDLAGNNTANLLEFFRCIGGIAPI